MTLKSVYPFLPAFPWVYTILYSLWNQDKNVHISLKPRFKFFFIFGTFIYVIKYTFTTLFYNGSTVWIHHNLFNWFSVIGHLFSPKFLSIISNVMIDNFEHKFYKAVFNTILFYMYGRSCPKYLHFAMFLLCVLWLIFSSPFFIKKNTPWWWWNVLYI